MNKTAYTTPAIEVFASEYFHLMANTLETEDERGPQGAKEADDFWDGEDFIEPEDEEFSWDDYRRPGAFEE